jgi:hypothetical protein
MTSRVVEMLGVPGAGKTTVRLQLAEALASAGVRTIGFPDDARELALRGGLGPLVERLPASLRSTAGWGAYRIRTGWLTIRELLDRPRSHLELFRFQRRRPSRVVNGARRSWYWYLRHLGDNALFTRTGRPGEVWLVDEGFVHRVVQLFSSHLGLEGREDIGRYLTTVPAPDLVVRVMAPTDVCIARIQARGVWDWLGARGPDALASFVAGAGEAMALARLHDGSRWPVVEVDNSTDGSIPPAMIETVVARIMGSSLHG